MYLISLFLKFTAFQARQTKTKSFNENDDIKVQNGHSQKDQKWFPRPANAGQEHCRMLQKEHSAIL